MKQSVNNILEVSQKLETFKVRTQLNTLSQYEDLFNSFPNWKENKREINLLTLLEEKKIEFELEVENWNSINSWQFIQIFDEIIKIDQQLMQACAVLHKIKMIISKNLILDLEVTIKFIHTHWGRIISEILSQDINLELLQYESEGVIKFFYFTLPNRAA
jgi:hypothetical protein